MICKLDDCERPFYAKKMCSYHYKKDHKYGDPLHENGFSVDWSTPQHCPQCKRRMRKPSDTESPPPSRHKSGLCRNCAKSKRVKGTAKIKLIVFDELGQTCKLCQMHKPFVEFGKSPKNLSGFASVCRRCNTVSLHGITLEHYDFLLQQQEGKCAICKELPAKPLAIDHDHSCCPGTKSCGSCVRGLLCMSCNVGIGNLKENRTILESAINYLERG